MVKKLSSGWVAQLVAASSLHQKGAGSILGQSTYLGRGWHPWMGHVWEETDGCFSYIDVSLSSPLPFLSKNKKTNTYPRVTTKKMVNFTLRIFYHNKIKNKME